MKTGLFLPGGGAKGAFQAGVIYALKSRGVKFDIISGTSIGAINGYFVFTDTISALQDMWLKVEWDPIEEMRKNDELIENKKLVNLLHMLPLDKVDNRQMFVNYVDVSGGWMMEKQVELSELSQEEQLKNIRYSGLLPRSSESQGDNLSIENAFILRSFLREIRTGKYDGMSLDGGLYNNNFLRPFVDNKVDRLFCVVFERNYQLPEYIADLYDDTQLCIIEPPEEFGNDTLRFDIPFREKWFKIGYELGRDMDI